MAPGWRLQVSTPSDRVFTDAADYDAVIRTLDPAYRVLIGSSSNAPSTLRVSASGVDASGALGAEDVIVAGTLALPGFPDVAAELARLAIPAGSNAIADSNVLARHIAEVLPVPVGGTGLAAVAPGALLFGSADPSALAADAGLAFDAARGVLSASNYTAGARVHAFEELLIGRPGGSRFRFFVDPSNNLAVSAIDAADSEIALVNFADVAALLSNVAVYAP